MKLVLCIVLLVFTAPLCATNRLSDTEILAQLDEATASEARWILAEDSFVTGVVGFVPTWTRAATAYHRLLKVGDVHLFELLTRSDNSVVVAYGIQGVAQLAPKRIARLLTELAPRREPLRQQSGCIVSSTSPIELALYQLKLQNVRILDTELQAAWNAWLSSIKASGLHGEKFALQRFLVLGGDKLLSETLKAPEPACSVAKFLNALMQKDELGATLELVMALESSPLSRQLALEYLVELTVANENHIYFFETDAARQSAKRIEEPEIASLITLKRWELEQRWFLEGDYRWHTLAQGVFASHGQSRPFGSYPSRNKVKKLLDGDNDATKAEAQKALDSSLFEVTWDAPAADDLLARFVWLGAHFDWNDRNGRRKEVLKEVLDILERDGMDTAWTPNGPRPEALVRRVLDCSLPEHADIILACAVSLSGHTKLDDRYLSYLLMEGIGTDPARRLAAKGTKDLLPVFEVMIVDAEATPGYREVCANVLKAFRSLDPEFHGSYLKTRALWAKELVVSVASNPKTLPPPAPRELRSHDERIATLLDAVYEGKEHFTRDLPDDAVEHEPTDKDAETLETIFKRMQDALAKLDE